MTYVDCFVNVQINLALLMKCLRKLLAAGCYGNLYELGAEVHSFIGFIL